MYNVYLFINLYCESKLAIAAENAMPINYEKIMFTSPDPSKCSEYIREHEKKKGNPIQTKMFAPRDLFSQ